MNLPDHIDPEDMAIYLKEWALCGYEMLYTDLDGTQRDDLPKNFEEYWCKDGPFADYSYVRGGRQKLWIKVPLYSGSGPGGDIDYPEALEIAQAYVVPRDNT